MLSATHTVKLTTPKKDQLGITLIECLMAISLGLLLMGLLTQLYLTATTHFVSQQNLRAAQDKAIIAMSIVTEEIKLIGHIGCLKLTAYSSIITPPTISFHLSNSLQGEGNNQLLTNSFTLRYARFTGNSLETNMEESSRLQIKKASGIKKDDLLMVSDCRSAEIFRVAQVYEKGDSMQVIAPSPLHKLYDKNAEVSEVIIHRYFVSRASYNDKNGVPIYALYRKALSQPSAELVSGLYSFKIIYTLLQDGGIRHVSAHEVVDWGQVVGIEIEWGMVEGDLKHTWYSYTVLSERVV